MINMLISKKTFQFLACLISSACSAAEGQEHAQLIEKSDLGIFSIGETPQRIDRFKSSDCQGSGKLDFSDCSALDTDGRRYSFFGGALARVSVEASEANQRLKLPANVRFGEKIELVARKIGAYYKVRLDEGTSNGHVVFSSGFDITSKVGIRYSIELIADNNNRLTQVIQRTDF